MATANKGPLVGTIRNLMDEHAGEDFGIPVESPSEAPKKTRPTIFTSLVSASFISPEAIKRKKYLEKYFTIRVEPQVIRLLDYAPGETIIASATIKNYSKRAKRITLHPPADSRLSLHQDTDWSTILISPGLEKVVKVVLKVPEDHSDRAASVITDQIIVDIDDGKRVVIPFEAFPASPKIEMQSSLDFGFLIQEALNSKDGKDLNIASREVTVVNKGKRGGSFSWTVDSNSPIKVFPQKFHIDAFNPSKNPEQYSKTVRVEFRPENLGIFKTDIQLVTDSMIPSFKTRGESSANDKYQLSISANVFKHKLRLKYPDGFREVNLDDVNFGPVYCFQTSKMDVCLENRSPETLHWVLCHAQESSPLVPRSVDLPDIFDSKASNKKSEIDDDRTALIAEPSEGVIGPFQSIKIGLIFTPETALASLGFKANVLDAPIKSYAIPMLLKTVHKSRKNQLTSGYAGESPISITVRAKACPLKALTSTHIIDFHNALADELVKSDLLLKNDSDLLGYSFKFRKIAHIDLHPNQGIVSPRGSFKIEVSFKPRQLGNFQFPLLCDIFEYDAFNMHDNVKALEPIPSLNGRYFFKEETFRVPPIKTLKLKVNGNCLPRHCTTKITGIPNVKSSHFMDDSFLKQKGHEQMPVNPEWEEKSHHRHKYVEFLRQQRIERSERRHAEFFGDAIDSGVSKAGLRQVDRDNGLKLPECRSSFGMMPQELKSAAEQESEIVNNRRLRQLFSKLKDPELYKSAHEGRSVLDTGDMSIDTPLTTADLSKIYASTEILDFGLVTIHSSNVQFINFMNATRSVSPVHIEIQFSKDSGTSGENVDDITIVPSKLFLSSMSVQGVAVTFKGHRSDKFSYRLTYTINGRYRYSIPVTVRTILPNLELSVHDVNLLAHSEPHTGKETIQSPGYSDLGTNRRRSSWEDFLIRKRRPSTLESISVAESITIRNTGNYPCSFSWDDTENTASSVDENAERLSRLGISYEGRFDINPLNGVIEAHGSAKITVSYTPGIKPRLDKEFHCRIIDAFDKKTLIKEEVLKCKGQVPVGNCHVVGLMRNSQLDLGIVPIIPLDMSASNNLLSNEISLIPKILSGRYSSCGYRTVKLKNSSPNPCSYFVTSASKVGKVVISPDSGVIKGNCTSHEISFVVIPNKPGPHDDSLLIHIIGGGRVIRIPIHYEAYPVKVVATLLETGGAPKVFLGSEVTRKIQVTNKGSSLVRCVLDLREHQDIDCQLEISELVRSALKVKRDKLKMQKQATNKDTSAEFDRLLKIDSGNELYHFDRDQKDHSNISLPLQGILYVFDILPGETIVLTATFKPTKIQKVGNVSLSFLGTGTEPVLLPLCLESVPSPVSISRTELNFKNKVVYKNFGIGNLVTSTKGSTSVKNETTHSMDWYLDLNPLDSMISSSIFRFEPSGGVLLPGQTQIVNVSFMPDDLGLYRIKAPLVLEYEDSRTRLDLAVSGTGVDPCLAFEPPEIFLPILPTGEFAIVSFYVINYGCERAELQSILPDELTSQFVHFELSFPEGRTLKSDGERLKIHLEYSATSQATERRCSGPISFSTKIEFVDTIGRPFFLSVNGTSDNSYFTLSPYIWQRRRDRAFVFNDSSLTFASSQIAGEVKRYTFVFHRFPFFKSDRDRIPIFITPAGIVLYESSDVVAAETYFRGIGFSISRWFDQYIGFDTGIDFPESIIESNGRAVINLLTGLTGRSVTGLPVSGLATKPEDRYKYAYKQNVEVINYLKGFGLLLCTVKPEFLLSESDFVRFVENHFEKLVCKLTCTTAFPFLTTCKKKKEKGISVAEHHKEYYKGIRQRFRIVSMEAWTTVFLQIMKKFAFSGINTKHFKSLPAVVEDATLASVPSIKSPIYGLPESVLLRWASYHVSKECGIRTVISHFDELPENLHWLGLIIRAHIPEVPNHYQDSLNDPNLGGEKKSAIVVSLILNFLGSLPFNSLDLSRDCSYSSLDIPLLLAFLYQVLPQFVPRMKIDVSGTLFEATAKRLELSNNTNRTAHYRAFLDGCSDFQIGFSELNIAPNAVAEFDVKFKARFLKSEHAILKLVSSRVAFGNTSVVLFPLFATVSQTGPSKQFKISSPLYMVPPISSNIEVKNVFTRNGRFKINFQQARKSRDGDASNVICHETYNPTPFVLQDLVINIEAGATANLKVIYQPFEPCETLSTLHFIDSNVGEFFYTLQGIPEMPLPIETFNWSCKTDAVFLKSIRISPQNFVRDRAINASLAMRPTTKVSHDHSHGKMDSHTGSFANISKETFSFPKTAQKYTVNFSNAMFSGPSEIVVKPPSDHYKEKRNAFESDGTQSDLPIQLVPKSPGVYKCQIVLTGKEIPDIRIFNVIVIVKLEALRANLYFTVPARQTLTQDIPFHNNSGEDWTIKASIIGRQFTGPSTFKVPACTSTCYPITFQPLKSGEFQSALHLTNLVCSVNYSYQLKGRAEDPGAEEKRVIVCAVRDQTTEEFLVKNTSDQEAVFEVKNDLPYSEGPKSIKVAAGKTATYVLTIIAKNSGIYHQTLTFTNKLDGSFLWYSIELKVTRPSPEDAIALITTVRKPTEVQIPLFNPSEDEIEFKVTREGPDLSGTDFVALKPGEEKTYTLLFYPVRPCLESGLILFASPKIGEFCYKLDFAVEDLPPVPLPKITAALGKQGKYILDVKNPTKGPELFTAQIVDSLDFLISSVGIASPENPTRSITLNLSSEASSQIQIVFSPSSSGALVSGLLEVTSPSTGKESYILQGLGTPPEEMDQILLSSPVGVTRASVFTFINPLRETVNASVTLPSQGQDFYSSDFELATNRKSRQLLAQGESFDIAFNYTAKSMTGSETRISVELGSHGKWVYPVKGFSEMAVSKKPIVFEAKRHETLSQDIEVPLSAFKGAEKLELSEFSCAIEGRDGAAYKWAESQLQALKDGRDPVALVKLTLKPKIGDHFDLLVRQNATFSQWRQSLRVLVPPPPIDDTIFIDASPQKPSSVTFSLRNRLDRDVHFEAYFTKESNLEYSVSPKSGIFKPGSPEENQLTITYQPTTFGKKSTAILMVESDDLTWSFEVRGATQGTPKKPIGNPSRSSPRGKTPKKTVRLPPLANQSAR